MLKLVKGDHKRTGCYHKRTGLTETVLVISISVCTNRYSFYRNSAGTSRKCLVYPEFLVNSVCIKWMPLYILTIIRRLFVSVISCVKRQENLTTDSIIQNHNHIKLGLMCCSNNM